MEFAMNEGAVLEAEREASTGTGDGDFSHIDPAGLTKIVAAGADCRLGRVISISGSQVIFLVEDMDHDDPAALPALQIGSLVKMPTPHSIVFGMISGLSVPIPARDRTESELKIGEMDLIGESPIQPAGNRAQFRRGVSTFPLLGTSVFAATLEDLSVVYARPAVTTARIGAIHQDRSLPAHIVVDDLLGKHFAILGATGSGKSCAVALILRAILGHHRNAHIILLDPHNEYSRAFGDTAEVIDLRSLQMPYWLFNFQEFCEVLVHAGVSIGTAEAAILNEFIPAAKRQFLNSADARHITVDTPSPYRMTLVLQLIDEAMGRLEKPDSLAPYQRLKAGLNGIMGDARFNFMFGGLIAMRDNMAAILSRLFRLPVDGKPATILDLSGLPSEILNVVVSVICRISFDFALWSDGAVPILLVCEEAHRYAPEDARLGFEPTKRALSRIAKEGRKYGLSLCVVTQRPSELAAGMLSQCNTIFALRLGHQRDQEIVRAAMSESAFGLLDALPSLGNAEAIAVGEGVSIPMRLAFDQLPAEHRPKSGTAAFSASWQKDTANSDDFLNQVIDNWRRQRR
jgi:hypothetical protein